MLCKRHYTRLGEFPSLRIDRFRAGCHSGHFYAAIGIPA